MKQSYEVYNSSNHEEEQCEHTPIRGSIIFLVSKLLVILLMFELIYGGAFYVLSLGIPLPFDLHHHVSVVLFVLEIVKIVTQVFLILNVSLSWANSVYFISGKHLIKRTGVLKTQEDIYEFETVRTVALNQSWLGKIFDYGDISLKTSASGGYQVIVTIAGVRNPRKYEQMIKDCM